MTVRRTHLLAVTHLLLSVATAPVQAQHAPPAGQAPIRFDAPVNGWRYSAGDAASYTQPVHYPAVAVSTPEGQSASATIAGAIRNAPKPADGRGAPATLVVNGAAMPQRVDADGHFSRPYAFGAGSNSVEMIAADGQHQRVQFYEGYAGKAQARLRVVLSWDSDGTDLDLHVVAPDGQHAFYGDRVVPDGGALDVDVTTGYGPEIYSNATPPGGTYLVFVNYYGSGDNAQVLTVARITVITDENTPDEKQQSFQVPLRKAGELTQVASFVLP